MNKSLAAFGIVFALGLGGCASIPPEAPQLSAQLGTRISSIEAAHTQLLEDFFSEKRRRVDQYIQDVWVPVFAREFFSDPKVDEVWRQVVQSQDPRDRLKFITLVGPRLQEKINKKRMELIQPLDQLERTIKSKLNAEYDHMRAMNNTLTSFLLSASKVEENRRRYLDMVGIADKEKDLERFIKETDDAVSELVEFARNLEDREKETEKFRDKVGTIIERLRR